MLEGASNSPLYEDRAGHHDSSYRYSAQWAEYGVALVAAGGRRVRSMVCPREAVTDSSSVVQAFAASPIDGIYGAIAPEVSCIPYCSGRPRWRWATTPAPGANLAARCLRSEAPSTAEADRDCVRVDAVAEPLVSANALRQYDRGGRP
jgi:hypothetical protein